MKPEPTARGGYPARGATLAGVLSIVCLLVGCGGNATEATPAASDASSGTTSVNPPDAHATEHAEAPSEPAAHPATASREAGYPPEKDPMHDTNTPEHTQRGVDSLPGSTPSAGLPGAESGLGLSPSPIAADAIALARSSDPTDHERLVALLLDPSELDRLDTPELAQVAGPESLQLGLVLREAAARSPAVLDRLVASPLYAEPGHRQITLIDASASAREPGESLVAFWRSQLDPEADELESTIQALVRNQSPPALAVLGDALTSERFDDELVFWWFRGPVLERRQDGPVLSLFDRLLKSGRLSERRGRELVDALFEYRPGDWYIATEEPPHPPARATLNDRARDLLRSIADTAARAGFIDGARRAEIESELMPGTP